MQFTRALWQHRQPMIRFLGKRSIPKQVDHTPAPHPASPTHELPESFASYRTRAQQHGPLGGKQQGQRSAAPAAQQVQRRRLATSVADQHSSWVQLSQRRGKPGTGISYRRGSIERGGQRRISRR
ncbi:hypothetical protein BTJ68_09351 [Hortaea werneckii EXF-2000]|uniref:Uncharacterized protein n=1 Tax=Hortaea werneckii EXF-2000 TaxID=1157616 RepID=A0A1Z5T244_HORWE|nr:hypothetical protein BTJ68_09351 [Hortaea werneckii EXF-2000]